MKNRELTIEEQKQLQLEILIEIDTFCKENNIVYSLAYGTLLGAVRHHGYIPWDDDLDIMMPLPDMIRFQSLFKSDKLKCHCIMNDNFYNNPYNNVCSKKTYRTIGKYKYRGLGIDLYPLVGIPQNKEEQEKYFETADKYNSYRKFVIKWNYRIKKLVPFISIPLYTFFIKKFTDFAQTSEKFESANCYYLLARPMNRKDVFSNNIFDEMTTLEFEGYNFPVISQYDSVLRKLYGNYMELPPVEQRIPHHGQEYYWE